MNMFDSSIDFCYDIIIFKMANYIKIQITFAFFLKVYILFQDSQSTVSSFEVSKGSEYVALFFKCKSFQLNILIILR